MTTSGAALLPLAHAGEGATWQALLTLLSLGAAAVVLLAVFGVVKIARPDDLVLPLAAVAVLASLSGATSSVLSDWVGWAFPVGIVAIVLLVLAALTPVGLGPGTPLFYGGAVVAVIAALLLHEPITVAWHPAPELAAESAPIDDLEILITAPDDGAALPAGDTEIELQVRGGTLGAGFLPDGASGPDDPEELVVARIFVDGILAGRDSEPVPPQGGCADGCSTATYVVELTPGEHTILVDVMTADGRAFALTGDEPTTTDRITVTVE